MADYDPIPMLENAGYTEQEAAFLYLVAVHSGHFLRRQFSRFVQRDRGGLADKFIQKALRLDHLRVIECGQARHVYHMTSRPMYWSRPGRAVSSFAGTGSRYPAKVTTGPSSRASLAITKFIDGEPMNPATKRFSGAA